MTDRREDRSKRTAGPRSDAWGSTGREDSGCPTAGGFAPPIDMQDLFRQLIADELRAGRLTPWRRRRIVRYAAQLGLNAVQAGRLVEECRQAALDSTDALERRRALRLAPAERRTHPVVLRLALIVCTVVLVDLLRRVLLG